MFKKFALVFGLTIILVIGFFVAREVLAVTASTNYKIYGGQVGPNSARVTSDNYIMQTGGQPDAGKQTGTNYNEQSGSVFSRPAVVAEETTQTGGGGMAVASEKTPPIITDLWITSLKQDQTKITFNTDELSVCYLQYGIGEAYDKQTDSEASYGIEHSFLLDNLLPNTKYSFTAHLRDKSYNLAESKTYSFITAPIIKTVPNVSQFVAAAGQTSIKLSWKNPTVTDFLRVKLTRGVSYFPLNDTEGEIMYAGKAESLVDTKVKPGVKYYYTLFAYDSSGNVSSGAVAMAKITEIKPPIKPTEEKPGEKPIEKPEEIVPPTPEDILLPSKPELPQVLEELISEEEKKAIGIDWSGKITDLLNKLKQKVSDGYDGLSNTVVYLSDATKQQLNQIKYGLIDGFGKLQKSVYDALTPAEKERVEQAVVQETAKEIVLPKLSELPEGVDSAAVGTRVGEKFKDDFFRMFTLVKRGVGQSYEGVKNTLNILSQGAKGTAEKVGLELNVVKNGLVDQFGSIRQDVYESLTPAEKIQVEKIIEEVAEESAVKTFAPDSIIKAIPLDTASAKGADWHVVSGSEMLFTISAAHFAKPVRMVIVTLKDDAYIMKYNGETNNFEAVFKAPEDKGKYKMSIQIIYTDNSYDEIFHTVLVDPYGFVYTRRFSPNWSKNNPLSLSLFRVDKIVGAEVALFSLNKVDEWVKWPADMYNQTNPQLTGGDGSFVFLSPSGKYKLSAKAKGYGDFVGEEFEVGTGVVNMNIELKRFGGGLWITLAFLAILCGFVVVFACKRWYNVRKKK